MNKKIVLSITILLGFFYLIDFGYARLNFGIIGAIKNKGDELTEKVEKKREEVSTSTQNNPPNIPSNPTPEDGATEQSINVDISWTGGDPDIGDTVSYDVYFGTSTNPPLISGDQTTTTYDPGTLSSSNSHYWKVVAKDNNGASTSGSVWRFEIPNFWGTAQLIENDNIGDAYAPQVAIDSSRNAIAVWHQFDGSTNNIWSNRYEWGTDWGIAQLIEIDGTGDAEHPQVAVDISGNAIAVWHQFDGSTNNICSNRYELGTGWGTAQLIEIDAGYAYRPQVAIDSNGNAIAVWQQSEGTTENIWSNRYEVGIGWGTAQLIETDNAGDAYPPQVAIDTSGNAIAVWSQWDGIRENIWSNRYEVGIGWGTAQLIETDDAGSASTPRVAVDSNGNAIAVWRHYDTTTYNICSNKYEEGTGWGTAQLIEITAEVVRDPQVAMDTSGNAIAVWYQWDGTKYNIWSNRYEAGTGWGTAQLIETDIESASDPQVAIDSGGNAIAVWSQWDGTRRNIWSNRYVSGTGWGTAQLIETDNAVYAYDLQVTINSGGNAIAIWSHSDGIRDNIWSNRYE